MASLLYENGRICGHGGHRGVTIFFWPIAELSEAESRQSRFTCDTQLKMALTQKRLTE